MKAGLFAVKKSVAGSLHDGSRSTGTLGYFASVSNFTAPMAMLL